MCAGNYLAGSPATPFDADAQTAFITNMFDPHDTCNVCITGPGVRRDHPDPTRAIHLTKWLVKAPYTDENEEISLALASDNDATQVSVDGGSLDYAAQGFGQQRARHRLNLTLN